MQCAHSFKYKQINNADFGKLFWRMLAGSGGVTVNLIDAMECFEPVWDCSEECLSRFGVIELSVAKVKLII